MNGILHRLAAQAMGSSDRLRTAARAPYSAPALASDMDEHDTAAHNLSTAATEPHSPNNDTMKWDSVPGQKTHRGHPREEIGAPAGETEVQSPEAFIFPAEIATKNDRPNTLPATDRSRLRQAVINTDNMVANQPQAGGTATPVSSNASAINPLDKGLPVTDGNYPAPLLPLKNPAPPAVAKAAQRGQHRTSEYQGQVEEITEVHVSIGRIEVTAAHEPAPTKRQAPAQPRPMTLDAYLARRREA